MARDITFKEIREYCSRFEKVEICNMETGNYEVYENILAVPEGKYDELFLIGFGPKDVECYDETNGLSFVQGMEIMLSERPRGEIVPEEITLKDV